MTATINGETITSARLVMPAHGAWWLDADFEAAPSVSGSVRVSLPGLELSGTVVESKSGTDALVRSVRVVGGAAGLGRMLGARAYHNDSPIRARTVIEDAIREAGETAGDLAPTVERLGVDYVRRAGTASATIEDAAGGAAWWVAANGRVHVGTRDETDADMDAIEVLEYDPRSRIVTLAVEDLSAVGVGSRLTGPRLDAPQAVRDLVVELGADRVRVMAWCGSDARGRLAGAFRAVVSRAQAQRIYGSHRYRVGQTSGDRVDLQPVERGDLPDLNSISMWPGFAGVHASLTPGAHVLVEFLGGDPRKPVVSSFAGKDGEGWKPASITVDVTGASASIKLGANASKAPAWAQEVRTELTKIQTTLSTAVAPSGGGPVTYGTPYTAPVTDGAIGAAKTVCE